MTTVTFPDGTILRFEKHALIKMLSFAQTNKVDKEAGGILLGKQVQNRNEYIISDVSVPNNKDIRRRFSFVRNKDAAQCIINRWWWETKGVVNYLGEWHTHPELCPVPSQVDRTLIKQVIDDHSNVFTRLFLIIVGTNHTLYIGLADSSISNAIIYSQYIGEK